MRSLIALVAACAGSGALMAHDGVIEEVLVVGITPTEGAGLEHGSLATPVRRVTAAELRNSQVLDLTDFMARRLGSVNLNSAQGNPLQPDIQLRGFTASPLLGLPQGLAVYQDGARINEPLGDAVNWDLVPLAAIHSVDVIHGASPLFGLNTLGGALVIDMKNGFDAPGHAVELAGGSWRRSVASAQSGGNDGTIGYYAAIQHFREDGWRDLSASEALGVYGALGWRDNASTLDLGLHLGDSDLRGNGTVPVGLLDTGRDAIFTAPDITRNALAMVTLEGTHEAGDALTFAGNAFRRRNGTRSRNGDASEFTLCRLGNGVRLLEGLDDALLEPLGLDEDELCRDGDHADARALEDYLNARAGAHGFGLGDLTDGISGELMSDAAIDNHSDREQSSGGLDLQFVSLRPLDGRANQLVGGVSAFDGRSEFASRVELAELHPVTRSTEGLGTGTFVGDLASEVRTRTRSYSLYLSDTWSPSAAVDVTFSGRWNITDVRLRDASGVRPELDGDHRYRRFNPSFGVAWQVGADVGLYASYAESSRAPTPIELSCNEQTFLRAMEFAVRRGEDPDDVEFECRLPNAFVADPPLDQVVARGVELGVRGRLGAATAFHLGVFRITNSDDIVFQTTGRATGLFANVDRTRRSGVELELSAVSGPVDWYLAASWLEARFAAPFHASSPNHPQADMQGRIAVERGDRIPGIPRDNLKIGADWSVSPAFAVGVEIVRHGRQFLRGDEANELDPLSGYGLFNLRARYRLSERLEVFARIDNVLDEDYENFGLVGEDPGEVIGELEGGEGIFVGPGAPRAAWIGVRFAR